MAMNQLYAKESICRFGMLKVDYLGHLILGEGVKVDPKKLQDMLS